MRRLALLCPLLSLLACASPKSAPTNDAPSPSGADAAAPTSEAAPAPEATKRAAEESADKNEAPSETEAAQAPGSTAPIQAAGGEDEDDGLNVRVPMISGGLDRDIIRRVAKDRTSDLQGCVPKALAQNPALSELLTLELSIDPKGKVSEAEVAEGSAFTLSEVERCVLELAKGWEFPSADNGDATELTLELGLL